MQWGGLDLGLCIKQRVEKSALGYRIKDHIKVIYTYIALGKQGPFISQSVHKNIVCSKDVKKLNMSGEMGGDSIKQPSAFYGSCGITMNHFIDDLCRVSENHWPGYC